jgi:hypothetical protein
MSNSAYRASLLIAVCAIAGCAMPSHRVGQSATVQFGVVRSAQEIELDSAAAEGAVIGGTLGLVTSGGNSGAKTVRNAIIGAAAGGAIGAAAQGNRRGMQYTVDMVDGSSTRIVTDQREIREGDCVAIERVRETANIRRTSAGHCDRASERAVKSADREIRSHAVECESAKRELAAASNQEEADLAIRKIELLCNG